VTRPVLGPVAPDELVPVAERGGLIHELTFYVLEATLVQIRAWQAVAIDLRVAVNLSPAVLRDVNWPTRLLRRLAEYRVPLHCVTLDPPRAGSWRTRSRRSPSSTTSSGRRPVRDRRLRAGLPVAGVPPAAARFQDQD
jgi:hypothetical protein